MKTTKLKPPRRVTIKGVPFWQVEAPAPGKGRIRKTFRSAEDARIYHERAKVAVHKFGSASMGMDEKARADAVRALEILAPYGVNLIDVARDYAARAAAAQGGKNLADAVADFTKAKADKSDAYKRDLKGILDAFKEALPAATTASVTTAEINDFLAGLHPVTANNRRRVLAVFFNWCVDQGQRMDNPAERAKVAKVAHGTPGIIKPEELAAMLAAAEDSILPAVVLGAFAGLRQAEIKRLDWRNVDLAESVVTLDAGSTKTNSRRAVRLPAAAVAWLTDVAKKHGPVFKSGPEARAAWDLCRMAAGFGPFQTSLMRVRQATAALSAEERDNLRPWPENALRHSAISYRLALSADAAASAFGVDPAAVATVTGIEAVAYAMGNSPKIIRAHYDALGKPSTAGAWFNVSPAGSAANVVPMRKQA